MKQVFAILLMTVALNVQAQTKSVNLVEESPIDTTIQPTKKDTAFVPVPVYEKSDTVKAAYTYQARFNTVKLEQGYVVIKGFKVVKDGKLEWVQQPTVCAVLDRRKRPAKKIIQVL